MSLYIKRLIPSPNPTKKWRACFSDGRHTDFGSAQMSDYTLHHDRARKKRYQQRHIGDLRTGDPTRPGFLSWYILWGFPSITKSVRWYNNNVLNQSEFVLDPELRT